MREKKMKRGERVRNKKGKRQRGKEKELVFLKSHYL